MRLPRPARIRAALLFGCLVAVAATSAHQHVQTRRWAEPLEVVVYPLNGDADPATDAYIGALSDEDFDAIERWGAREATRHALALERPFRLTLGATIDTLPPPFPGTADATASPLEVLAWTLRFRWWAWRHTPDRGELTRVRVFVVYHQGEDGVPLAHSLGLSRGLLGLVHAFAEPAQTQQNNIVIAHEILHTVGASDKYARGGEPRFPEGYAEPARRPLHPQPDAEIMAGRLPSPRGRPRMPEHLGGVRINEWTAAEINWLD